MPLPPKDHPKEMFAGNTHESLNGFFYIFMTGKER